MLLRLKQIFFLLVVFILVFLLVAFIRTCRSGSDFSTTLVSFFLRDTKQKPYESFTPSRKAALNFSDMEITTRLNEEYARLTKAVIPSVVSIDTAGVRTERLMDFFGRSSIRSYPTHGQGSGVIVSKEGHVITNHHVTTGQNKIRITLHGGKTYDATMIGEDPLLDIAVIKIDSEDSFIPLKLGDSSQVEVGQIIFAVGNPFGLGETVTQGIISAKERSLSENQRDLFQTDAAINPGNSGGPLVNLTGEIIGINSAIYSPDRNNPSFQGVGFSIPSNEVREALEQIISRGRPIRGYLGVQMRDLDSAVRIELGYMSGTGSAVFDVTSGAPADKAGLKSNDVVVSYNGETIKDTAHLIFLVQRSSIEKQVTLTIWREGEFIDLKAIISEASSPSVYSAILPESKKKDKLLLRKYVGIEVRDLTVYERAPGHTGVLVTDLLPESKAAGILERGDLIIRLNDSSISNLKEFYFQLTASIAVQPIKLNVVRAGSHLRLSIPVQ